MRRRGIIEHRAAMRMWQKLGIQPIPDLTLGANKRRAFLSTISNDEKKMMAYVAQDKDEINALKKLPEMHPGTRELRMMTFINRMYEQEEWKENVERCEKAREGLYKKFSLKEPNTKEKLEAMGGSQVLALSGGKMEVEKCNLEMATFIALKLRGATEKGELSVDKFISELGYREVELLMEIAPGIHGSDEKEAKRILGRLDRELKEKIDRKDGMKPFHESVKKLKEIGGADITALRKALADKKENQTLLEFFREGERESKITFHDDRVFTQAKGKRNGDSAFSADIEYENGEKARIDGVFDGVSFSKMPGEASGIAKEVFEIMIQLNAPKNADDIKLIMTTADLAILSEYGNENTVNLPSTTGVVTLTKGKNLIGVHAGDSRWMVFRDGKLSERSMDHSYEERMASNGLPCPPGFKNQLASTLGNVFDFLDSSELEVKNGDIVVLCSDGISSGVHENEIAEAISYGTQKTPGILLRASKSEDDKTVIVYGIETGESRISFIGDELDLTEGRNKMAKLALKLGVGQEQLETAMISLVHGDYELATMELPTESEMFELEMILESADAEKMARIAVLLEEVGKDPAAKDNDNRFKQLHELIKTLDGDRGIQLYDRFHFLLGKSGKFDRPAEKIKKKRKFKKRKRRK